MSEFQVKIKKLIDEMMQYKNSVKKGDRWIPLYDEHLDQLQDILEMSDINEEDAIADFNTMMLSKYESFNRYAYTKTDSITNVKHNEVARAKMTRTNHKKIKCPQCGVEINAGMNLDEYRCSCGYVGEIVVPTNTQRSTVDSSKHIIKLLDAICGITKHTKVIINILPQVRTWVTNKRYLYEWLHQNNTVEVWINEYNSLFPDNKVEASEYFANMDVEPIPDNAMSYEEFRLYTVELYNMFESYSKIADKSSNNMISMDIEDVVRVVNEYVNEYGNELPQSEFIYIVDGERYALGNFINFLSLIHSDDDYPVKKYVEAIFNRKITKPGLMYNFNELRGPNNVRLPSKFQYGQEFAYFMHEIFNVPYPTITPNDRQHIVNLIIQFNNFYKAENKTFKGKSHNAPLFACSLVNIIKLPYFIKYRDSIMKLLPDKSDVTVSLIASYFIQFKMFNPQLFTLYLDSSVEELPPAQDLSNTAQPSISQMSVQTPDQAPDLVEEDNEDDIL